MGKWSDLPLDLIECVEEYLDLVDKVRIRAVCASWNSYLHTVPKLLSEQIPWLLLEDSTKGASLYTVHEAKTYSLNLPEIKGKIFKGSSCGWIVLLDDENSSGRIDDIYLFNPLTRAQIKLPPRSTFPDVEAYDPTRVGEEYIIKEHKHGPEREYSTEYASSKKINEFMTIKVVLSSSPSSNDCIAIAMYGNFGQLAWCRPHHKKWISFMTYTGVAPERDGVVDVIFHNGKLHALYLTGKLEIYESIDPQVIVEQVVIPGCYENRRRYLTPIYLVECLNLGLILVSQGIDHDVKDGVSYVQTFGFYLYKIDNSNDGSKTWVTFEGLGDNMLFLGLNTSLSVPVSEEIKAMGYKKNSIYYTDHYAFREYISRNQDDSDMAICNFDESFIDPLPGFILEPEFFWPPPIWITPGAY